MISIVVMLILAGVSLNATVGDNGIISKAKQAKTLTALASLQEAMDYLKVEKMQDNNLDSVKLIDFSYEEYPATGFLRRVNYASGETYVFDMNYMSRLSADLAKNLTGGYGLDGTIYQLKDVYGINEDFTVWYRDSDGNLYGASDIKEVALDPNQTVSISSGILESLGLSEATIGNTRGKDEIILDGDKMTNKISNLDDLSLMPNLKWLKLKNLTLDNLNGLQYLVQLEKITFDNAFVADLSGLKYANQVTGFYLINGSVTEDNMASITEKFAVMPKLQTVRIRYNLGLTKIPALTSIGNISELWIEENTNLTNIYGLSTVQNKTSLKKLYLSENNLTDNIVTTETHFTYGYLLPVLDDSSNIVNLSYLDGYIALTDLDFRSKGGYATYYEDNSSDITRTNCSNSGIHYLNGIKNNSKIGIDSLTNLRYVYFNNCDILDCDYFEKYNSASNPTLKSLNIDGNKNLANGQVTLLVSLMSKISISLDGKYAKYQDTNKSYLDFYEKHLTDLSFLENNLTCTSLNLSYCDFDDTQTKYIASMKNLKSLTINNDKNITDFSFLNSLTKLTYLGASNTKISDEDLTNYILNKSTIELYLFNCPKIDSLDWLKQFPRLRSGDIRGWSYSKNADMGVFNTTDTNTMLISRGDLTTMQTRISSMNSSYGLHLTAYGEEGLRSLEKCTAITSLYMSSGNDNGSENGFYGTESLNLNNCTVLKNIYFQRNMIENILITGCSALESYTMSDMQRGNRSNVPDFSKNKLLQKLVLSKNYYIQDDLTKLVSYLEPKINQTSGEYESGCPNLSILNLNMNKIATIQELSTLVSLQELYLTDNNIISIKGIENLVNLTTLDIRNNNAITSIQPILDLMQNKNADSNVTNELTVYIKGCTRITDEMCNQMTNAGITVVK